MHLESAVPFGIGRAVHRNRFDQYDGAHVEQPQRHIVGEYFLHPGNMAESSGVAAATKAFRTIESGHPCWKLIGTKIQREVHLSTTCDLHLAQKFIDP